jgi:hypothetical protein
MAIPKFDTLPEKILADLKRVRDDLHAWAGLPKIVPDVIAHWDDLIEQWICASDLPLIVRKGSHEMVCQEVTHSSGRRIAPSDNSPAHWVLIQCFDLRKPTIQDITKELCTIPMTMAVGKKEAEEGRYAYPRSLAPFQHAGKRGWYLAHKRRVGIGIPSKIESGSIDQIHEHFRRFMKPSNMMLIPKEVAGLAELDFFFDEGDVP